MTKQEASERYNIPIALLDEYESWGLCQEVKKVMGSWQYDDSDLERLSMIMTLHDVGFTGSEIETYMRLLQEGDHTKELRMQMLTQNGIMRWTRSTSRKHSSQGWTTCDTVLTARKSFYRRYSHEKRISMIMVICLLLSLTACGVNSGTNSNTEPSATQSQAETSPSEPAAEPTAEAAKMLVVYFSVTGNTKAVAEEITRLTGADLYEIVPAVPYTDEDLNYNNNECRANQEMNDASARPAIGSEAMDVSSYDTVFIGYPIWWGTMPRIINTFLDTFDLSGKTVLPFCTSGSSGITQSVSDIRGAEPDADVRGGLRASGANDSSIENWIADNGISE